MAEKTGPACPEVSSAALYFGTPGKCKSNLLNTDIMYGDVRQKHLTSVIPSFLWMEESPTAI